MGLWWLSVLMLGVGYLYAGRWKRALGAWLGARATECLLVYLMSIAPDAQILRIASTRTLP